MIVRSSRVNCDNQEVESSGPGLWAKLQAEKGVSNIDPGWLGKLIINLQTNNIIVGLVGKLKDWT